MGGVYLLHRCVQRWTFATAAAAAAAADGGIGGVRYSGYPGLRAPRDKPKQAPSSTMSSIELLVSAGHTDLTANAHSSGVLRSGYPM